jgi:hypothetical protein
MMEEEMENQIHLAEEQLKLTENKVTKKELEQRKGILEKIKLDKEAKFAKMEDEIQKMEEMYKERLEYQIKEANILLAMEGADDVSDWLLNLGDLLEHTIPPRLYELYKLNTEGRRNLQTTTKLTGCLTAAPNLIVTIQEKESWAETYKSKCELISSSCFETWVVLMSKECTKFCRFMSLALRQTTLLGCCSGLPARDL